MKDEKIRPSSDSGHGFGEHRVGLDSPLHRRTEFLKFMRDISVKTGGGPCHFLSLRADTVGDADGFDLAGPSETSSSTSRDRPLSWPRE